MMLNYILQTIAFQLFFLIIYDLLLKKETFFNWNRAYLLSTSLLSLILPFIKIDQLKHVVPENYILQLPEVFIGQGTEPSFLPLGISLSSAENSLGLWTILLFTGMCIASILFTYKIIRLVTIIRRNPKQKKHRILIISLLKSTAAFSFFHYIFLGEKILPKERASILNHEIVHVKQKHTLDLLYFEILRIVFWFNPLIYMYQNKISALHEYIADARASKNHNKNEYYQNLLSQVFETQNISFINTFFKQSLIKKRIVMLSKSKSKQIHLLKYALLIPIVAVMLVYTSCSDVKEPESYTATLESTQENKTPLIEKIKAMKKQMEIQGEASEKEEKGIALLLKVITGTEFDSKLVEQVHAYTSMRNKTPLMEKISAVFVQIQVQGNISNDEEKALKGLLLLVTEDGFNNPIFEDVLEFAEIPFGVIDQIPIYPGCEGLSKEEQKKCMSKKITQHVIENFNTKVGDSTKLPGRVKIASKFTIDNKGLVKNVTVRAPKKELVDEAKRVINLLPKMKPGMQSGKAVNVPYSLPIIFEIKD